jgi:hypothetical protein
MPAYAAESSKQPAAGEQSKRDEQFIQQLTGVVLEGTYTTTGQAKPESKPDRYEISGVTKLPGDFWLFQARYGDLPLPPLPLKVLWAGDTPVITMDDFTIPKLGTFSFRVMFDRDLYAGTWKHDDKGGHMIGTVRKKDKSPADTEATE